MILKPDLCVIGAGTGGLVVAAGASQMGAETVLIERGEMGGDCLNFGCVPSKSMIAAAAVAQTMREAEPFGIRRQEPDIDFGRVQDHVRDVVAAIAPHDSVARFEGLGVRVIRAHATFTGADEVQAGEFTIRARRFVVATGSSPFVPPIPGLDAVPFLTNETVFDNRSLPSHLVVIGGGPIGIELAQAHRRLGARVTVVEMATLLPKDDPEFVEFVRRRLRHEGVEMREGAGVTAVARSEAGISETGIDVTVERDGESERLEASHILVAAGRRPNVADLGLEAAGIAHSARGIEVDARLRTGNRRVFAVGDVTGGLQFTHVAAHHAGIVLRNALFRLPAKVETRAVPWVTYTDPELAHVGMTEAASREGGRKFRVLRFALGENDRAVAERAGEGLIKVVTARNGRVLGASIVAPRAGELILPWVMAVRERMKIGALASVIAPYPNLSEISKSVAGTYYTPKLFGSGTRKLVRFLARFG